MVAVVSVYLERGDNAREGRSYHNVHIHMSGCGVQRMYARVARGAVGPGAGPALHIPHHTSTACEGEGACALGLAAVLTVLLVAGWRLIRFNSSSVQLARARSE